MGILGPAGTPADVLVIGAGVSGLTTAICLAEAGLGVRVLAEKPPARTTSAVAGASWGPYLATDARVPQWSLVSLGEFEEIAERDRTAGVSLVDGIEAGDADLQVPAWAREVSGFRMCTKHELPSGYEVGWRYRLPLMDMPVYLRYLERRLRAAGVTIETGVKVERFDKVMSLAPIVVNCTGLAARDLVDDAALTPIRGQLVVVKNPGVDYFFQDNAEGDEITYFLPHGDKVVLGGTLKPNGGEEGPDAGVRQGIIDRCATVDPLLADPIVLEDRVGLRPARDQVRLERDGNLVHNYGHGGSGVTMSWGCARSVVSLITG